MGAKIALTFLAFVISFWGGTRCQRRRDLRAFHEAPSTQSQYIGSGLCVYQPFRTFQPRADGMCNLEDAPLGRSK